MKIYLIPGLGFDHRIFQNLGLEVFDIEYINWIEPKIEESFRDYAIRLSSRIADDQDVIIIGHSLGGMMAQEIARLKKIKKVILISSIKSKSEIPFHFSIVQPLRIYKLISITLCIKTVKYWGRYHGYKTKEEVELFKSMVGQYSNNYLQWALKCLSTWNFMSTDKQSPIFQIHGAQDRTFPIHQIDQPEIVIQGGGHFMVFKDDLGLKQIIKKELNKDLSGGD